MRAAERYAVFVAHLAAQRPLLGKTQMVRVPGRAAADEAGLAGNEPQVHFVLSMLAGSVGGSESGM